MLILVVYTCNWVKLYLFISWVLVKFNNNVLYFFLQIIGLGWIDCQEIKQTIENSVGFKSE